MTRKYILFCCLCLPVVLSAQHSVAITPGLPSIEWDSASLKQVSPPGNGNANYARMISLSDGGLLCVYETGKGVECISSKDFGGTWIDPVLIAANKEGVNMAVPDILELDDHSLLVSYNPRPHKINGYWDSALHFAIRTKKSYDRGKTWTDERLIYEAGAAFEDGCWEPAQIQLPSGEIRLYFSDEAVYTKSSEQNISMFTSFDRGLTWSGQPTIISFTPGHRDGMPVPIISNDQSAILFSIEDNGHGQFKPSIIRKKLNEKYSGPVGPNDKERNTALIPPLPDTVYAGAPFLRQMHQGCMLLSYQSTINRHVDWKLSCMQVAIGDKMGKKFSNTNLPFNVPIDKHGLWNSLCILPDDTIIAVTSTNAYSSNTAIWMIKGKLNNGE